MSSDISFFTPGTTVLVEVTISRQQGRSDPGSISFTCVVAADPLALLVAVTTSPPVLNSPGSSSGISTSDFTFGQNYPNPFNPSTKINYERKRGANIRLVIFDIAGKEIERMMDQYQNEGIYVVTWNSYRSSGYDLSTDTSFVGLQVGEVVVTRRMLLTK